MESARENKKKDRKRGRFVCRINGFNAKVFDICIRRCVEGGARRHKQQTELESIGAFSLHHTNTYVIVELIQITFVRPYETIIHRQKKNITKNQEI